MQYCMNSSPQCSSPLVLHRSHRRLHLTQHIHGKAEYGGQEGEGWWGNKVTGCLQKHRQAQGRQFKSLTAEQGPGFRDSRGGVGGEPPDLLFLVSVSRPFMFLPGINCSVGGLI